MMDMHQRLWASVCAIEAELEARIAPVAVPPQAFELSFNGGVAAAVAAHYAGVLTDKELPEDARILDLGCGFGRIALALARRLGPKMRYDGLDPNADGVDWAQRNITPHHPNFRFGRIDIKSLPYNPHGTQAGAGFRFPFADDSLDLVFMISVLTHVDFATTETYLRESARVLRPGGRLVATMFLLDDEVDRLLAAGKGSFRMAARHGPSRVENPANPELAIAHPRDRVLGIAADAGFARTTVFTGSWSGRPATTPMDFQDLVIADRSPGAVHRPAPQASRPPVPATPDELGVYACINRLTHGEEGATARFVTWSNAVALNALWWQCDGWDLAIVDGTGTASEPPLRYPSSAALRALGLHEIRPDGAQPGGGFHALDDAATLGLLIGTGRIARRQDLHETLFDSLKQGLRLHEAMAAGGRAVLLAPRRGTAPAGIPAFTG